MIDDLLWSMDFTDSEGQEDRNLDRLHPSYGPGDGRPKLARPG